MQDYTSLGISLETKRDSCFSVGFKYIFTVKGGISVSLNAAWATWWMPQSRCVLNCEPWRAWESLQVFTPTTNKSRRLNWLADLQPENKEVISATAWQSEKVKPLWPLVAPETQSASVQFWGVLSLYLIWFPFSDTDPHFTGKSCTFS